MNKIEIWFQYKTEGTILKVNDLKNITLTLSNKQLLMLVENIVRLSWTYQTRKEAKESLEVLQTEIQALKNKYLYNKDNILPDPTPQVEIDAMGKSYDKTKELLEVLENLKPKETMKLIEVLACKNLNTDQRTKLASELLANAISDKYRGFK